jgi:hypothetical protein
VTIQVKDLMSMSMSAVAGADYDKMIEIAKAVSEKPALLADFDADPLLAAAKVNGFEPPPGFHMHIVDEQNVYHPKEDDALTQISTKSGGETWTRMEVRAGYNTIACTICVYCR